MADAPGPLLATGRRTDVYDLGDGRVLRRYRDASHDAEVEARVMRHVAERGYPVPRVDEAEGTDLVMERVDGPTMAASLAASPWSVPLHARRLARLQRRLAAIEAPDWLLARTADQRHPHSVLHLQLAPTNVVLAAGGPVVLDWTEASEGPAGFDAALTFVELSTAPATTARDRAVRRALAGAFRSLRRRRDLDPFLGAACDHRLADPELGPDERVAVADLRRRLVAAAT